MPIKYFCRFCKTDPHSLLPIKITVKHLFDGYFWERVDATRTDFDLVYKFLKTLFEIALGL